MNTQPKNVRNEDVVIRTADMVARVMSHPHVLIASAVLVSLVVLTFSPLLLSLPGGFFRSALTEALIVSEVNADRATIGTTTLRVHPKLSAAAQAKAEDMIARDYFAHLGPDGEKPWVWLNGVGYVFSGAGENLAVDFADSKALITAWLNSPSHKKNVENGYFTDIGIGVASGEFQGRQTNMVVMFVGRESATTLAAVTAPPP